MERKSHSQWYVITIETINCSLYFVNCWRSSRGYHLWIGCPGPTQRKVCLLVKVYMMNSVYYKICFYEFYYSVTLFIVANSYPVIRHKQPVPAVAGWRHYAISQTYLLIFYLLNTDKAESYHYHLVCILYFSNTMSKIHIFSVIK